MTDPMEDVVIDLDELDIRELEAKLMHIRWKLREPKLRATQSDALYLAKAASSLIARIRKLEAVEEAAREAVKDWQCNPLSTNTITLMNALDDALTALHDGGEHG